MINRYVLLVGVFVTAAGLLMAMGYTLESHAASKTAAATDTVRCHFDPALRQEAITEESARSMAPEKLYELVSRRIENLKSTNGLSDEQRARIERIQTAHTRRNAQLDQAIAAEQARSAAITPGVTPDAVARLQREQMAVDVMVWNHAHDVLDANQKLRLQLGCREGSPRWAWFVDAFRKS